METKDAYRKIKVYCGEHQTTCEVKAKPQIVCTIEEHTLSNDFPNAEFWEYCVDCQTFLPTRLRVGSRAVANCPNCDRRAKQRFLCQNCKTISFESDEPARGKNHHLRGAAGIEPNCPGCQIAPPNVAAVMHRCKEIDAEIFTARTDCPFCLEKTTPAADVPKQIIQDAISLTSAGQCPRCRASNPPTAIFCGKCKERLRTDVVVTNLGGDVNKTQLLGSLCPNCSTPVPPDSGFCGECGQAVKKAAPPPPPPPPPSRKVFNPASVDLPVSPEPVSASDTKIRNIALGVGGVFLLIVILAVASNTLKSSDSSSTYNSNNSSSRTSNSRSTSGNVNPTRETNFSVVGRYGYITINVNLRSGPDRRYDDLGTLYQDTRVKILQVAKREDSSDWWEIEVENPSDYGCSSVDSSRCGKDDPSDSTQGWINSKFVAFR